MTRHCTPRNTDAVGRGNQLGGGTTKFQGGENTALKPGKAAGGVNEYETTLLVAGTTCWRHSPFRMLAQVFISLHGYLSRL